MEKKSKRKTFYYFKERTDVDEWIKSQHNLSRSISELIHDEIKRSGYSDYIELKLSEKD